MLPWNPFTSPCRGKRRVSTPSSKEATLALLMTIQATRPLDLIASTTLGQACLSSVEGHRAARGAGGAAAVPGRPGHA